MGEIRGCIGWVDKIRSEAEAILEVISYDSIYLDQEGSVGVHLPIYDGSYGEYEDLLLGPDLDITARPG